MVSLTSFKTQRIVKPQLYGSIDNLLTIMAEQSTKLLNKSAVRRGPTALILASVVSGFAWYFNGQRLKHITNQKKELIRRVEQGETAQNFKKAFDYHKPQEFQCKKISLEGVIGEGRFFVKRNRGKQEGYYVLAPFVVNSHNSESNISPISIDKYNNHTRKRKFILNLGWIPRSRKYLVYDSFSSDFIGEEIYKDRQEALAKQREDGLPRDPLITETTVPVTNISAYVRRGEVEDKFNGRVNFKESYLYKYIDLPLLTRVFRVFNQAEGETVYLDRAVKASDEPESFPLAATQQSLIEDLNIQIKNAENNSKMATRGISGVAFGVAAWMTFL